MPIYGIITTLLDNTLQWNGAIQFPSLSLSFVAADVLCGTRVNLGGYFNLWHKYTLNMLLLIRHASL